MTIITKNVENVELTPVGLGPWSYSKVKVLSKCPFQFYLKYILKAKPATPPPVSVITETGKAAHRILELVIMGKGIEDAFRAVRREYEEVLPGDLWNDGDGHEMGGVGRAEYSIVKFKERIDAFEKKNPVKRFITELKIGVTKDWEPTGFFAEDVYYRGVIDLIIQLNNGDIIFLDHKYGPDPVIGVRNFQDQLNTYKVLFSKGIESYNDAQSGIHFVRHGEIVMGSLTPKADVENTLANRVEFSINGAIDKVKDLGFFKHIASSACQWCEFSGPCKSGALKERELDSKKYFPIISV